MEEVTVREMEEDTVQRDGGGHSAQRWRRTQGRDRWRRTQCREMEEETV